MHAALAPDVGGLHDRAEPIERGNQRGLVVGAHHAAAAGQGDRLHHAWKVDRQQGPRVRGEIDRSKPGSGQAGIAQPLTGQSLAARDRDRRERVPGQVEHLARGRRDDARPIPHGEHAVDRLLDRGPRDGLDRRALMVEPDRQRRVLPRIVQDVAAIGGKHQIHAKPFSRVAKRSGLIPRRRREQQHPTHQHPALSALSAPSTQHPAPSTLQHGSR